MQRKLNSSGSWEEILTESDPWVLTRLLWAWLGNLVVSASVKFSALVWRLGGRHIAYLGHTLMNELIFVGSSLPSKTTFLIYEREYSEVFPTY